MYSVFLDIYKILDFLAFIFENGNFDFWGLKHNISKIRNSHFVERVILHLFGVCWLPFTLKSHIPEAFECWTIFDRKSRDMKPLNPHFLKNFTTDFSGIFLGNAKLMLNKVL